MPVPAIYKALQAVHTNLKPVLKSNTAPAGAGGYRYRGIDDILDSVHDLFVENGIIVTQHFDHPPAFFTLGRKSGAEWHGVGMPVRYRLISTEDGTFVETGSYIEGADDGDKAGNKAMANGLKYSLMYLFLNPPREPGLDSEAHDAPKGAAPLPPASHGRKAGETRSPSEPTGIMWPFKIKGKDGNERAAKTVDIAFIPTKSLDWYLEDYEPSKRDSKYAGQNAELAKAIQRVLALRKKAENPPASAPAPKSEEPPPQDTTDHSEDLPLDDIPF